MNFLKNLFNKLFGKTKTVEVKTPTVSKDELKKLTKVQLLEKANQEFGVNIKKSLKKDEVVEELLKLYE